MTHTGGPLGTCSAAAEWRAPGGPSDEGQVGAPGVGGGRALAGGGVVQDEDGRLLDQCLTSVTCSQRLLENRMHRERMGRDDRDAYAGRRDLEVRDPQDLA